MVPVGVGNGPFTRVPAIAERDQCRETARAVRHFVAKKIHAQRSDLEPRGTRKKTCHSIGDHAPRFQSNRNLGQRLPHPGSDRQNLSTWFAASWNHRLIQIEQPNPQPGI